MLSINENGIQIKIEGTNKIRYVSPEGIRESGDSPKYYTFRRNLI